MLKILHVDETFHPSFGYQINSLAKYQSLQGNQVVIVTTDNEHLHPAFRFSDDNQQMDEKDKLYMEHTHVQIIRVPVKKYVSSRAIYRKEVFKAIESAKPDVVMLHQIETFVSIIYLLKHLQNRYPTIADSHMLRMASKNKLSGVFNTAFRLLITPKIIKGKIPVIKTQNDDYVNSVLGIPDSLTPFLSFGSDLEMFRPDAEVKKQFRLKNNISMDDFVILYTGKMDEAKGGLLLAEAFSSKFVGKGRNVSIIIVGNIYDDPYGTKVRELFDASENNIIRFPTQKYPDLPMFYQASDLCVFAKQCSLSFYDAQACGLPVVFEDNNINRDRANHGNGKTFRSGDADDFRRRIQEFIDMDSHQYDSFSSNAVEYVRNGFGYDKIASEYTDIMKQAIIDHKRGENK